MFHILHFSDTLFFLKGFLKSIGISRSLVVIFFFLFLAFLVTFCAHRRAFQCLHSSSFSYRQNIKYECVSLCPKRWRFLGTFPSPFPSVHTQPSACSIISISSSGNPELCSDLSLWVHFSLKFRLISLWLDAHQIHIRFCFLRQLIFFWQV